MEERAVDDNDYTLLISQILQINIHFENNSTTVDALPG
jgi:hypothetical protein